MLFFFTHNQVVFLGFSDPSDLYAYVTENKGPGPRFMCKVCCKPVAGGRRDVRDHIENSHFRNSFIYTCDLCSMELASKVALKNHKAAKHR